MIDDQAKALAFYTEVLGFLKKQDIPINCQSHCYPGVNDRWPRRVARGETPCEVPRILPFGGPWLSLPL